MPATEHRSFAPIAGSTCSDTATRARRRAAGNQRPDHGWRWVLWRLTSLIENGKAASKGLGSARRLCAGRRLSVRRGMEMARSVSDILAGTKTWKVRHRQGHVIFGEGEPSQTMYLIESGCVRLQIIAATGERQIVAFLFAGELFGFSLKERTVSAEAVTDVVLRCWSNSGVLNLSLRSKAVTMTLIGAGDSMFTSLAHHVGTVTRLPAKDRFLWFVDGVTGCPGVTTKENVIRVPMSRRDIADYLSLTPETLSRAIGDLETQGTLKRQGRQAFVLKRPTLAVRGLARPDLISDAKPG